MHKKYTALIFLLVIAALTVQTPALADSYTVKTSSDKFIGTYLVNQSGFTLYYTKNDSMVNDASTCYGECAATWTPFYDPILSLPDNLRSFDFGSITRSDGTMQTTFKGWPLYLYIKDNAPGDVWGEGVDGVWYMVDPDNQPQVI